MSQAAKWVYVLAAVSAALAIAACSKSDPPDLVKPQREALEKAKKVEQTVGNAAAEMQKKIEEAETK